MALTRARCLTGTDQLKAQLEETIAEVISQQRDKEKLSFEVKDMRERIEKEKGTEDIWDIKQVRGGLVDIEFICQYLQLLHAGSHPEIINTNTEASLKAILEQKILDEGISRQLVSASHLYTDLIQIIRLCTDKGFNPETASLGLKLRLAKTAKLESFEELCEQLRSTQSKVKLIFDQLFA